jgi:hypothetical protein
LVLHGREVFVAVQEATDIGVVVAAGLAGDACVRLGRDERTVSLYPGGV